MKFFESDLCFWMSGIAITVFEWCFTVFLVCFLISGVSFCCRHGKGSLDPPPASPQHCPSPWPLAFPIVALEKESSSTFQSSTSNHSHAPTFV